ncbi:MAG: hypothetical protein JXB15_09570 [Anaerolineales bacterium]|nr:hypothetical protein [Anaerolineales bacterium]
MIPNGEVSTLLKGGPQYYERRYITTLTDVKVQATGNQSTPDFFAPLWTLEHRGGLVGLIPRNEACTEDIIMLTEGKNLVFRAVIYAGPYVIRATVEQPMPTHAFETYAFMPAKDVQIDCQLPGARLVGFRAPLMVVNQELWQGYHPE